MKSGGCVSNFRIGLQGRRGLLNMHASSNPSVKKVKYLFYRPFTKIDKFRQKLVDFTFSLFTLHSSLFTFH